MNAQFHSLDLAAFGVPFMLVMAGSLLVFRLVPDAWHDRLTGLLAGLATAGGFAFALGGSGWQVPMDAAPLILALGTLAGFGFALIPALTRGLPGLYVLSGGLVAVFLSSGEGLFQMALMAGLAILLPWRLAHLGAQGHAPSLMVLVIALTLLVIAWQNIMPNGYRLSLALIGTALAMAIWNIRSLRVPMSPAVSLALGLGLALVMIRMIWTGDLPLPGAALLLVVLFSNTLVRLPDHMPVMRQRLVQLGLAILPAGLALLVSDIARNL